MPPFDLIGFSTGFLIGVISTCALFGGVLYFKNKVTSR